MRFSKFLMASGLAVSLAAPVSAAGTLTQLQSSASRALQTYGYQNVDTTQLSSAQLAQITHLAGSGKGHGDIRGSIGAVLNNRIVKFFKN
jgi:hypothetical protein